MMDSKQRSEMRNVIKTFVSQNKGFSSRQIKNEVRKSGIDISATDISKYLKKKFEKDGFDSSDYKSSQVEYQGIKFIVYHPSSEIVDASVYFSEEIELPEEDNVKESDSKNQEQKKSDTDIIGFNFK